MAGISEPLRLEDQFTSTLNRYISMLNQGNTSTEALRASIREVTSNSIAYRSALSAQTAEARLAAAQASSQAAQTRALAAQERLAAQQAREMARSNRDAAAALSDTAGASSTLTNSLKNLFGAYIGLQGIKNILNMSDTLSSTTARIKLMNDGLQDTDALNRMIYNSAMATRSSYESTAAFVSKLGILAKGSFDSSAELVAFAEQINKQMIISGTTAAEAQGALLQLTQAMSSGVLRGEELNSVMEQTPMIAQTIADYLGVTTGEMRLLAAEGQVTADVVKNAMLSAAQETDEAFKEIPVTFGQAANIIKNRVTSDFGYIFNFIGQGSQYVAENVDAVVPALYGGAAAFAVFGIGSLFATGALTAFIKTLMLTPIGWIAFGIGLLVSLLATMVESAGGAKAAWLSIKNSFLTFVEDAQIGFKSFSNNVSNAFEVLKTRVLTNTDVLINGVIDGLNFLFKAANKIPGISFKMISHVDNASKAALENEINRVAREQELKKLELDITAKRAGRAQELMEEQAKNDNETANQLNYDAFSLPDYDSINDNVNDISKNTSAIKKSVDMSKEDIKSLVDIATRKFINNVNVSAQAPIVNMSVNATDSTPEGRKKLADTLRDILVEQRSSGSSIIVG